jgi:hypothetical protein
LFGRISWGWIDLAWPLVVVVLAWLGLRYFRRFSGHFEDFL